MKNASKTRTPTSGVFDSYEIMKQVEKRLRALPGITTSMDEALLVNDKQARTRVQITLTFVLEKDV